MILGYRPASAFAAAPGFDKPTKPFGRQAIHSAATCRRSDWSKGGRRVAVAQGCDAREIEEEQGLGETVAAWICVMNEKAGISSRVKVGPGPTRKALA